MPLGSQVEQRQISDTQKAMSEITESLIGYAIANRHLPCPAISETDGREDRTGITCNKRVGYLPWQALGISRSDAWNRLYRYSVTAAYANSSPLIRFDTPPDITIQTRNSTGTLTNLTNANSVPAVIISHGKNGYGAVTANGIAQALPAGWPATNPDENVNATGTVSFISRDAQALNAGGTGGEFDDLVIWLPQFTLFNRMVSAGKLP